MERDIIERRNKNAFRKTLDYQHCDILTLFNNVHKTTPKNCMSTEYGPTEKLENSEK